MRRETFFALVRGRETIMAYYFAWGIFFLKLARIWLYIIPGAALARAWAEKEGVIWKGKELAGDVAINSAIRNVLRNFALNVKVLS
jgi:hypothetical protein